MFVAPVAELVVDDLIGVYQGPRRYHKAQDGLNGLALNIGEHENGYIAGSPDYSQDRRLLFLKGSASRCAFECPAPPRPILAANGFRTSLVASLHVYFIALYYSTEFAAWLPCNDFPAKKGCHLMRYVWVEVQLHGNLAIGEI
jgi:hypothetical protein